MATGGTSISDTDQWRKTKPGVEWFLPGRHIQSNDKTEWEQLKSKKPFNNFEHPIPDSQVFDEYEEIPCPSTSLHVKYLSHDTTPDNAAKILEGNGFQANKKGGLGYNLIWWGTSLDEREVGKYTAQMQIYSDEVCESGNNWPYVDSRDKHGPTREGIYRNFMSSPPFKFASRYGNVRFTYSLDELLKAYKTQYCGDEEPDCRILGTFAYKYEIMHTIIVCPKSCMKMSCLPMKGNVVFKDESGEGWIWKPEITGDKCNYFKPIQGDPFYVWLVNRRWEHVTFAFYIPEDAEDQMLRLDNLCTHVMYCPAGECFRRHTTKSDRQEFSFNEALEKLIEQNISPEALINMLYAYLRRPQPQRFEMEHVVFLLEKLPKNSWDPILDLANSRQLDDQVVQIIEKLVQYKFQLPQTITDRVASMNI